MNNSGEQMELNLGPKINFGNKICENRPKIGEEIGENISGEIFLDYQQEGEEDGQRKEKDDFLLSNDNFGKKIGELSLENGKDKEMDIFGKIFFPKTDQQKNVTSPQSRRRKVTPRHEYENRIHGNWIRNGEETEIDNFAAQEGEVKERSMVFSGAKCVMEIDTNIKDFVEERMSNNQGNGNKSDSDTSPDR
jgi:hypothetical protein